MNNLGIHRAAQAPAEAFVEGGLLYRRCATCGAKFDISVFDPLAHIACRKCGTRTVASERIDQYQLSSVIGRGGMGIVYQGWDADLRRPAALKILRKDRVSSVAMEHLAKEATLTASINHPHVVKIYTVGTYYGRFYVAMELVASGTLDDLMQKRGMVDELRVLTIGLQIALGLQAASRRGLIHGDVKPRNILLCESGAAKITDFGLAALALNAPASERTAIWGTPYYVAPEKLQGKPDDVRSDIYSLGATLFHALAGRPPFEHDDPEVLLLKHLKSQAVSLQSFAPSVSRFTARVINRSLQKDPRDRYQNYDELIVNLQHARDAYLQNTRPTKVGPKKIPGAKKSRAKWVPLSIAAIVLPGLAVVGIACVHFAPSDWLRKTGWQRWNLAKYFGQTPAHPGKQR